ncbi:MAG: hypothetical protein LC808_28910 [Actinobacteria bacterium]|nr:hypothetical protein [Actinomycetota bacterium]
MVPRTLVTPKSASSCPTCLAWGVLYGGYCRACYDFRRRHRRACCAGCRRDVPLKKNYCRLCWLQAALQAQNPPVVTEADLAGVTSHQLAFAGTTKMRGPRSGSRRNTPRPGPPPAGPDLTTVPRAADNGQLQLHLPGSGRAFDWVQHAEPTNPALVRVRRIAQAMSQAHGWNTKLVAELDRALVILLSGHADGQRLQYSQLVGVLHRYGVSISRVAEVLSQAEMLADDRVPAFESWLKDRLTDLAPGIASDVHAWIRALQHGGPRSHPRNLNTVRRYLRPIHPVLLEWSTRYHHLREVTTSDVTALAQSLHGHPRRHALGALRSLMRHCKKTGGIFADPTTWIRACHRDDPVILPLAPEQLDDTTQAAKTPAARLTLVLAAVHAARSEAIRNLHLEDIDLGNRRLSIATVTRPLDELTHRMLLDWLDYRHKRWPHTANPHLIINKQTASSTRPISDNALTAPFRRRAATLEALRIDRQLDEALTHGADPLHLAVVFGLDETTAVRYATAARKLLLTPAEQDHRG